MKPSFLENVLRGAEALAARDAVGLLPDQELLKRFAAERDPNAFAVLVRRHGPLVWGVCRNLLLEDGEAEDAFQATFLALVKSVSTVNRPEAVGNWLHGVAYRVAMKARRSAARRKKRETIAASSEKCNPVADAAWDELQAAVHEEVCRLPEKLRLPFVLVGLQGRPQKEAAKQLGWTVGTFSARLCQARQQLLHRLAKRNISAAIAASATALGAVSGNAAVPTALVMKALNVVAAPDAVTPFVLSLSRGVTQMYFTRTKMLVAGVMLAGVLTTGLGARLMSNAEAQTPEVIADVERKLEALREQQAKGKWEYKFVPMDSPLPAKELQRVLASHDREGWEYCGSQDIETKGKALPHLTFKRLNKAFLTPASERDKLLLEAIKTYEQALKLDSKPGVKKATTVEELEKLYQKAFETQSDVSARQKALQALEVEAEAKRRAEGELKRAIDLDAKARLQQLEAEAQRAAAEAEKAKALSERDRAAQLQKQLDALKAEYEAMLKKFEEQKKAGSGEKKPAGDANKLSLETSVIPLRNVSAQEAAEILHKMLPMVKDVVIAEARTNSLILRGLPEMVAEIKQIVAKNIDIQSVTPPTLKGESNTSSILKPVTSMLSLKDANLSQKEVIEIVKKALPNLEIVPPISNNSITVKGTPGAVADAQAILNQLAQSKPASKKDPEKVATEPITLKHITIEQANKELLKHWPDKRVLLESFTNNSGIILKCPASDLTKAKLFIAELDAAGAKPNK